jgi:hypothetical protein
MEDAMEGWCHTEFSSVNLGDARLNRRLIKTAQKILDGPNASFYELAEDWSDAKSIYRLFENKRFHLQNLLEAHYTKTTERAASHSVILAIQDSSFLSYDHLRSTEGLGSIESSQRFTYHGMILHPTLAVTPDAKILGLLDLKMYERFGERRAGCKNHLNIP